MDATVECDEEIPAPEYEAEDNCGEVEVSISMDTIPGQCPSEYVIIRTYTATDECGNASSTSQTINVVDTTAPSLDVADDATVECDEDIPAPDYEAEDNCGEVEVTVSEETIPGPCPQEYVIIRTYLAMDECGNETAMTQTINVVDTTAPTLMLVRMLLLNVTNRFQALHLLEKTIVVNLRLQYLK